MVAHVNWDAVLVTSASVGLFILALTSTVFALAARSFRRQIRETVKPSIDALDGTLKEGFDSVATSMSEVRERIAKLEGIASRDQLPPRS